jgi:SAM-dependent methyltransferase
VHEHKRFDDEAATWDDDPGHEKRQLAVAKAIKEAVSLSPEMSAVDIGGGTARLSILLADLVGSVVVTDPSAGMVQVARERIEAAGFSDRLRAVQADLTTDRLDGAYDVMWSSMALHHVQNLDGLLRSVAGLLVHGGRLLIADLDEDPDGDFHADKVDFDGHHGFNRQRLAEQLSGAGFGDVSFIDATTILKNDREFGVFLCTATKVRESSGDDSLRPIPAVSGNSANRRAGEPGPTTHTHGSTSDCEESSTKHSWHASGSGTLASRRATRVHVTLTAEQGDRGSVQPGVAAPVTGSADSP